MVRTLIYNVLFLRVLVILNEPRVGLVHSNYRVIHCVLSTELGTYLTRFFGDIEFQTPLELTTTQQKEKEKVASPQFLITGRS